MHRAAAGALAIDSHGTHSPRHSRHAVGHFRFPAQIRSRKLSRGGWAYETEGQTVERQHLSHGHRDAVSHRGDSASPADHPRIAVEIGGLSIPFWLSWLAVLAAGALAYFGFAQKR
jgi:hypothetical protein